MSKCEDFFKKVSDFKILKKNSQSDSIIASANMQGLSHSVILKISFEPERIVNNALKVEEQIYKNVISYLIFDSFTPHIVPYITTVSDCGSKLQDIIPHEYEDEYLDQLENLENITPDHPLITVIYKSQGTTLYDMVVKKRVSEGALFVILFQIIYTLYCFQNVLLSHNDLHAGNVFIDVFPALRVFRYTFLDKDIKIKTRINSLIYDFDRASVYHPAVERNLVLDEEFCEEYKQCNYPYSKQDLQSILAFVVKLETKYPIVYKWVKAVTKSEFITDVQKREYAHIGSSYDYKDYVSSYEECLGSLVKEMEKFNLLEKTEEEDYHFNAPPKREIKWGEPYSTKVRSALSVDTDPSYSPTNEFIDTAMDEFTEKGIIRVWVKELKRLGFDARKKARKLYRKFEVHKHIPEDKIDEYLFACLLICIPFFEKFSDAVKSELFYDVIIPIMDDIYNTFGNIIPIKMPLI